jgi:hypothetical protein
MADGARVVRSIVMVTPVSDRAAMDALAEALGYGPDTFRVNVGPEGAPTHAGMHAWAEDGGEFHQLVTAVLAGVCPPALAPHADMLFRLLIGDQDADGINPQTHFASVVGRIT